MQQPAGGRGQESRRRTSAWLFLVCAATAGEGGREGRRGRWMRRGAEGGWDEVRSAGSDARRSYRIDVRWLLLCCGDGGPRVEGGQGRSRSGPGPHVATATGPRVSCVCRALAHSHTGNRTGAAVMVRGAGCGMRAGNKTGLRAQVARGGEGGRGWDYTEQTEYTAGSSSRIKRLPCPPPDPCLPRDRPPAA